DIYNIRKDTPDELGNAFNTYESMQKNELVGKTDSTIKSISPGSEPTADAVEGGKSAIDAFTDHYQDEKDALQPIFDNLKSNQYGGIILPDLVESITN